MLAAPTMSEPKGSKAWHSRPSEDVLTQVGSSAAGLSAQEAARRLAVGGPNELKEGTHVSPLHLFLGQFSRTEKSSGGNTMTDDPLEQKYEVGLGVMGRNLVLNMADHQR